MAFVSERTWLTNQIKKGRYATSIMTWTDWAGVAVALAILVLAGWKALELLLPLAVSTLGWVCR